MLVIVTIECYVLIESVGVIFKTFSDISLLLIYVSFHHMFSSKFLPLLDFDGSFSCLF